MYLFVSALLALMAISGFFGKANISHLSVKVDTPEEVYARTSFPLRVTLKNDRSFFPAFLTKVHIAGQELLFPFVESRSEAVRHMSISFEERGNHLIGNVYASSIFPFNFFTRFTRAFPEAKLLVFPRLKKGALAAGSKGARNVKGDTPSFKTGYESEMVAIRDYVTGDPLKYINWKATAKTGILKTREFSAPLSIPLIIDFDVLEVEEVEEKISRVSYLLSHLFRQGVPVGLKIKGKLFEPSLSSSRRIDMLRELALYPGRIPSPRRSP